MEFDFGLLGVRINLQPRDYFARFCIKPVKRSNR